MRNSSLETDDRITIGSVLGALEVQCRVLKGLILRETKTRYGRHKLGFFWMFFEPMFFVALFLAFKLLIASPTSGGMPDVYFIIAGVIPFLLFRQTMASLEASIINSRSLLAFPQVKTFDVILSIILLEFSNFLLVFAIMVIGAAIIYEPYNVESPLLVLYATLLLGISGAGVGMIFATLIPLLPSIKNISTMMLGRPLFFTSGIFFTADMLPESARNIVLYNPLLHMMEMVRSAYFVEFESQYVDWHYASLFAASTFLFGLLMHQALKNQVIKVA